MIRPSIVDNSIVVSELEGSDNLNRLALATLESPA